MFAGSSISHIIDKVDLDVLGDGDLKVSDREGLVRSTRDLGLCLQRRCDTFGLESPRENNVSLEVVGAGEAVKGEISIATEATLRQVTPVEPAFLFIITYIVGIRRTVEFLSIEPTLQEATLALISLPEQVS